MRRAGSFGYTQGKFSKTVRLLLGHRRSFTIAASSSQEFFCRVALWQDNVGSAQNATPQLKLTF